MSLKLLLGLPGGFMMVLMVALLMSSGAGHGSQADSAEDAIVLTMDDVKIEEGIAKDGAMTTTESLALEMAESAAAAAIALVNLTSVWAYENQVTPGMIWLGVQALIGVVVLRVLAVVAAIGYLAYSEERHRRRERAERRERA